jgi:hypothetical protein
MGEGRGIYSVLVVRPEGKTPLGRRGHRWTLRWILKRGIDGVNWIQLAGPVAGLCEHGNEPSGSIRKQDIF